MKVGFWIKLTPGLAAVVVALFLIISVPVEACTIVERHFTESDCDNIPSWLGYPDNNEYGYGCYPGRKYNTCNGEAYEDVICFPGHLRIDECTWIVSEMFSPPHSADCTYKSPADECCGCGNCAERAASCGHEPLSTGTYVCACEGATNLPPYGDEGASDTSFVADMIPASYNGLPCKTFAFDGLFDYCAVQTEGVWDWNEKGCVVCDDGAEYLIDWCGVTESRRKESFWGWYEHMRCESACGAPAFCDERWNDTVVDATDASMCSVGNGRTRDMCNSKCNRADTNVCDSDCGAHPDCDGKEIGYIGIAWYCDSNCQRVDTCGNGICEPEYNEDYENCADCESGNCPFCGSNTPPSDVCCYGNDVTSFYPDCTYRVYESYDVDIGDCSCSIRDRPSLSDDDDYVGYVKCCGTSNAMQANLPHTKIMDEYTTIVEPLCDITLTITSTPDDVNRVYERDYADGVFSVTESFSPKTINTFYIAAEEQNPIGATCGGCGDVDCSSDCSDCGIPPSDCPTMTNCTTCGCPSGSYCYIPLTSLCYIEQDPQPCEGVGCFDYNTLICLDGMTADCDYLNGYECDETLDKCVDFVDANTCSNADTCDSDTVSHNCETECGGCGDVDCEKDCSNCGGGSGDPPTHCPYMQNCEACGCPSGYECNTNLDVTKCYETLGEEVCNENMAFQECVDTDTAKCVDGTTQDCSPGYVCAEDYSDCVKFTNANTCSNPDTCDLDSMVHHCGVYACWSGLNAAGIDYLGLGGDPSVISNRECVSGVCTSPTAVYDKIICNEVTGWVGCGVDSTGVLYYNNSAYDPDASQQLCGYCNGTSDYELAWSVNAKQCCGDDFSDTFTGTAGEDFLSVDGACCDAVWYPGGECCVDANCTDSPKGHDCLGDVTGEYVCGCDSDADCPPERPQCVNNVCEQCDWSDEANRDQQCKDLVDSGLINDCSPYGSYPKCESDNTCSDCYPCIDNSECPVDECCDALVGGEGYCRPLEYVYDYTQICEP